MKIKRVASTHRQSQILVELEDGSVLTVTQQELLDFPLCAGDELDEAEAAVARRARNAHTPAHAKNAGLADYKRATALEAVFGWLSLEGNFKRLDGLMEICYELGKIRLGVEK